MEEITYLIIGIAVGAAAVVLKDKFIPKEDGNKRVADDLSDKNEKLLRKNKEYARQIEESTAKIDQLNRSARRSSDSADDMEDELDSAKATIKQLRAQIEVLERNLRDCMSAYESQKVEIEEYKSRS